MIATANDPQVSVGGLARLVAWEVGRGAARRLPGEGFRSYRARLLDLAATFLGAW